MLIFILYKYIPYFELVYFHLNEMFFKKMTQHHLPYQKYNKILTFNLDIINVYTLIFNITIQRRLCHETYT